MALIIAIINQERRRTNRIVKKQLRDTMNPFELSENSFIGLYRMPQRFVFDLIDEIRPFVDNVGAVPVEIQILSVLNFLASGSYQMYGFKILICEYIQRKLFYSSFSYY